MTKHHWEGKVMDAECKLVSDGTVFRFCITDKGYDDGGYFWTDASIVVENWCFNYKTSGTCLEFSEVIHIRDKLSQLTKDDIATVETVEFIEPDIQMILKPKHDLNDDGKYTYIKEGHEFEDISAQFMFFPFLDGALTEQYYMLPLYRDDIEKLVEYLTYMIDKLN